MINVIFEVTLKEGMKEAYLNMAAKLNEELLKIDGFIFLDRFINIENENKMISIQIWRDEEAISKWRTNVKHQKTMQIGFDKIFKDYTLKVLSSLRVYGKYDRGQSPNDFITN